MASKKKTASEISLERVRTDKQSRFKPIRGQTPDILARYLDEFDAGYLFGMALMMEKILERDDVLKNVAPKRMKAPARRPYEILTVEDSPAALRHKQELEFFYNNLTCTSAAELNQRGGFALLRRQMMKSVGYRYAIHEIVWRPMPGGLTAELREVPLWFFENITGKLRYLQSQGTLSGVDLEDGGWMVTVGDGLMIACSVAYMFKRLPLHDWLIYCDRHGMPGIHGKSSAARDSDQWKAMVEAVQSIAADFSCVTSANESIEKIDFGADGEVPYPKLVERMDRTLAALWRGADLSSISAGTGSGQGASLQGEETELLEADDCELLSETLNEQVDRWVIRYQTGDETPLAYIKVLPRQRQNVDLDLKVDGFLVDRGVKLSTSNALQRYGRQQAADDEETLAPASKPAVPALANVRLANTDGFVTIDGHVVFVGPEKDETDGGSGELKDHTIITGHKVVRESEKAVLIEHEGQKVWLPKSQIKQGDRKISVPNWLHEEKFGSGEKVKLEYGIKRESEKAFLVPISVSRMDGEPETHDVWLPKSQVKYTAPSEEEHKKGQRGTMVIPRWLKAAKEAEFSDNDNPVYRKELLW